MNANLSASSLRGAIPIDVENIFGSSDQFEILFIEGVLAADPVYLEALTILAHLYTRKKKYDKGLALDLKLSFLDPLNPITFYNLACSYALLDRADDAIAALHEAERLGHQDWRHMRSDPDLGSLRDDPRFLAIWHRQRAGT